MVAAPPAAQRARRERAHAASPAQPAPTTHGQVAVLPRCTRASKPASRSHSQLLGERARLVVIRASARSTASRRVRRARPRRRARTAPPGCSAVADPGEQIALLRPRRGGGRTARWPRGRTGPRAAAPRAAATCSSTRAAGSRARAASSIGRSRRSPPASASGWRASSRGRSPPCRSRARGRGGRPYRWPRAELVLEARRRPGCRRGSSSAYVSGSKWNCHSSAAATCSVAHRPAGARSASVPSSS